jgi:hypothetical protein
MDESGGMDFKPLSCIILPAFEVLRHDGTVEPINPKCVWPDL